MPKGRIGLSLDEDVLAILSKYGRSDIGALHPNFRCGAWCDYPDGENWKLEEKGIYLRPTRTEIVEQGVRMWAEAKAGAGISGRYMKPPSEGNGGLPEPTSTGRADNR